MIPEDEDDLLEEEESSSDDEKEGDDSSSSPDEGVQQVPSFETSGESQGPTTFMPRANVDHMGTDEEEAFDQESYSKGNDSPPSFSDPNTPPPDKVEEESLDSSDQRVDEIADSQDVSEEKGSFPAFTLSSGVDDEEFKKKLFKSVEKPEKKQIPSLPTSGEEPSREQDAANLGPMSYYKRKNIDKGRGDKIPGLEVGEDGKYRQAGNLNSGEERDEKGLEQQRQIPTEQLQPKSGGPLAVDMMPDIIPEWGTDGASSFKPDGQDSNTMRGDVESAADAIDTVSSSIVDVLTRLTINMKKTNDRVRQLMDKLEVEDHRDEF